MIVSSSRMDVTLESPIGIEYADDIARLANDRTIKRNIGSHSFPYPYTKEDAIFFIEAERGYGKEAFRIDFLIKYKGGPAGIIGLSEIDRTDKKAHVGYWIGKKFRGKGIATESLRLIVEYAKNDGFHRLYTSVIEGNYPSMIVLMRNGFSIEGVEKDSIRIGNRYYDFINFGKLIR
ncbi:acetyltransferase [Thermoplasma volcanium GSS1]|uniref:Acetyltransferase n=1 Tax=Thermoplasma volcanium (strain ATCC 51530 / DSM 4299 / JCM 9571 / NBRC 15438 / GSS1) TaxID=273116 RepID=Q97CC0_THEVO|nr:GNAT family protein [Thermoplasma volcanium]BAB59324.1 acetyltransferase [Thermoplasma volcanium GSS1]